MNPKRMLLASVIAVGVGAASPPSRAATGGVDPQRVAAAEPVDAVLAQLVAEVLTVPSAEVVRTADLRQDLGADSIDLVELVMVVEKRFEIKISDEACEATKTVGDLDDLVRTLRR